MYRGNRDEEKSNLEGLLKETADNPSVNSNKAVYNRREEPTGHTYRESPGSREFLGIKANADPNPMNWTDYFSNPDGYTSGYGGGMQDLSSQRGSGGTGGGSEDSVDNMGGNQLLQLNPYVSKNVVSFNDGGMFGEFAKYNHGGNVGSMGPGGESWRYEQNKLGSGNTYTASSRRYNPEVVRLEEKARRDQFMSQNNLPHGFSSSDERGNPYKTSFRAEQDRRQNERWLEAIKTNNPNSHNIPFESLKNPWEEGYDNWYGQAENGMRMPKYNDGGMMQQQQMPQQTESYAKQANDMIALAQLEAFGKKFLSQTKGEIPPEIAQAMNQQGMPQAANGMKRLYQQGGNYPHNMYNKETGYKIVAEDEAAHTKLAGAGFDHTPKAKYGMKMKRYTQGGRF